MYDQTRFYRTVLRSAPRNTYSEDLHHLHVTQALSRALLAHPDLQPRNRAHLEFILQASSWREIELQRHVYQEEDTSPLTPLLSYLGDRHTVTQTLASGEAALERDLRRCIVSTLWDVPEDHPSIQILLELSEKTRNGTGFESWALLGGRLAHEKKDPSSITHRVYSTWDLSQAPACLLGVVNALPPAELTPVEEEIFYTLVLDGIPALQAVQVARDLAR